MSTLTQADVTQVSDLLQSWIARTNADEEALTWLREKMARIQGGAEDWIFFTSFSGVPRYTGKDDLNLSDRDLREAEAVREGWDPRGWSVDQAGRTAILLSLPADNADEYIETLDRVFTTADVGESVALYQSLPLLPHPDRLVNRAAEGLRSNMTSVFNAVALRNPFPAEQFSDDQWNQMVLKAIFVGSPLYLIQGLDERVNPDLAQMLVDYAHERWAASREVTPELWRSVGPFARGETVDDLHRVVQDDDPVNREAGALALSQSPSDEGQRLLDDYPDLKKRIENRELTWESFSRHHIAETD